MSSLSRRAHGLTTRKRRTVEQQRKQAIHDSHYDYLEILCWIILAVASLSIRIVGCSTAINYPPFHPTSPVYQFVQLLLVLGQALLDISQLFAIPYNLLLNGMLIYVDSLTLQVSYE